MKYWMPDALNIVTIYDYMKGKKISKHVTVKL